MPGALESLNSMPSSKQRALYTTVHYVLYELSIVVPWLDDGQSADPGHSLWEPKGKWASGMCCWMKQVQPVEVTSSEQLPC